MHLHFFISQNQEKLAGLPKYTNTPDNFSDHFVYLCTLFKLSLAVVGKNNGNNLKFVFCHLEKIALH